MALSFIKLFTYPDALVESLFLFIIFVAFVRIQLDIVEDQFRFDLEFHLLAIFSAKYIKYVEQHILFA